jgi:hypothetical protein
MMGPAGAACTVPAGATEVLLVAVVVMVLLLLLLLLRVCHDRIMRRTHVGITLSR